MDTNNCPEEAYCTNTEYSYNCTCREGYCDGDDDDDDNDGCNCFKIGKVEIVDSSLTLFMSPCETNSMYGKNHPLLHF